MIVFCVLLIVLGIVSILPIISLWSAFRVLSGFMKALVGLVLAIVTMVLAFAGIGGLILFIIFI